MNTTIRRGRRPTSVNLALIIFLVSFSVSLGPRLAHAAFTDFSECIACASELIILIPLWFIFRGKNWARWVLVVLTFVGFAFRLRQLIPQIGWHSLGWVVAYRWYILVEAGVLVVLFLPSSNRWFRGDRDAIGAEQDHSTERERAPGQPLVFMDYLTAFLIFVAIWTVGTVLLCVCVVHFSPPQQPLTILLGIASDWRNNISNTVGATAGVALAVRYLRKAHKRMKGA